MRHHGEVTRGRREAGGEGAGGREDQRVGTQTLTQTSDKSNISVRLIVYNDEDILH